MHQAPFSRQTRLRISLLLSIWLLAQAVWPLLALASQVGDDTGQRLVLCTGQGFKLVTLDADGRPQQPAKPMASEQLCPACLLYSQLDHAQPFSWSAPLILTGLTFDEPGFVSGDPLVTLLPHALPIRAPPA